MRYDKSTRLLTAKEATASLGVGLYTWKKMERAERIPEVNTNIIKDLRSALLNQAAKPSIDEEILADPATCPGRDVMSRLEFWQEDLSVVCMHNRILPDPHAEWEDE